MALSQEDDHLTNSSLTLEELMVTFSTLETPTDIDPEKAALGRKLFHDPRLSINNTVSCASCHVLAAGGDDGLAKSIGVSGNPTARNSPTVFNLEHHAAYFWDGRAKSLSDQIDGPIHHPDEMGETWATIIKKLNADKSIRTDIINIYGALSEAAIKDAIVEFERSLVTNDSPFDHYLAGQMNALSPTQQRGLTRFVEYGCASCHQGPTIGGNLFQHFGIYQQQENLPNNRPKLKVPSLRNVEHTSPYFNDGRAPTLENAVKTMGKAQLGRDLTAAEIKDIVSFLKTLSSPRFKQSSGDQ